MIVPESLKILSKYAKLLLSVTNVQEKEKAVNYYLFSTLQFAMLESLRFRTCFSW